MAETLAEKLEKSELGHWMQRFEGFMVFVGVFGPFATLPQLIKLYFTHSQHATGQSLLSWSLYAGLSFLWFAYGLVVVMVAENNALGLVAATIALGFLLLDARQG